MALETDYLILGGTGLIGSALCRHLERRRAAFRAVNSATYAEAAGAAARVVVNCNGNTFRYRAHQDPVWDFDKSVASVARSLQDIRAELYVYLSTVDVYSNRQNPAQNHEDAVIDPAQLDVYGFHKWVAERLVERFASRWAILRLGTVVGPGLRKGPIFDLMRGEPLHMSLDSELTLIDTATIADTLDAVTASRPDREIFNVTGIGGVRLGDLAGLLPVPPRLAPGAEAVTYRYDVSAAKVSSLRPMPASAQVARRFLDAAAIADRSGEGVSCRAGETAR
ncbi:MAG: NAD(P)-dependent oxidoreductase [Candidatus Omnitrophica bacterium]|nr:NAD(P)-dependent oxidoreductase [Candidatus Omnitrophota bacterium]